MGDAGIVVIAIVGFAGAWLYIGMVAENRLTRPERVRKAIRERMERHGCQEEDILRVLAAYDRRQP